MARYKTLKRVPIEDTRIVYRVVGTSSKDPRVLGKFLGPDSADPTKKPDSRELKFPELQEGMSVYRSEEHARIRWAGMRKNADQFGDDKVRQGEYLAELELTPGEGFDVEDRRKRDGHLTIWGDPLKLAATVRRVFPAERPKEEADE